MLSHVDSSCDADADELATERGLEFLQPRFAEAAFPWLQVGGYGGSLALTLGAYLLVLHHVMPPQMLIAAIVTMAVGQAALQLGVFMHLREGRGPAWQIIPLGLAFFTALGMIGMSIWIMAFKSGVS